MTFVKSDVLKFWSFPGGPHERTLLRNPVKRYPACQGVCYPPHREQFNVLSHNIITQHEQYYGNKCLVIIVFHTLIACAKCFEQSTNNIILVTWRLRARATNIWIYITNKLQGQQTLINWQVSCSFSCLFNS